MSEAIRKLSAEITPQMIIEHTDKFAELKKVEHESILDELLEQVQQIDFVSLAGVNDASELKSYDYEVIVIEEILRVAQRNTWGLCRNMDFVYAFNGHYWSLLDKNELERFLGRAAEKMGVRRTKSKGQTFLDRIYKQFFKTAYLGRRQRKEGILIPLQNGTFEIRNGERELKGFDRDDFITYQLPFAYDPYAKAPTFERYLDEVLPDKPRQLILAEFLGYLFTTGLKLEKALILYGTGANGKSVAFEIISALLGADNVSNYSLSSLTNDNGYYRVMLANKLVNYCSEINGTLEASIFKQLVSGEPVEARLPYGEPVIIRDYAKLIFNTNSLPHDVEHTNAFFRRFLIIPFDVTINPEDQDAELSKKIIANELPGVFNWVLSGLDRILTNRKFTECDAVRKQLEEYRKQSDSVAMFLEDKQYQKSSDFTLLKEIYGEYRVYCIDSGYRTPSIRTLSERLRNLGYEATKRKEGIIFYLSKR